MSRTISFLSLLSALCFLVHLSQVNCSVSHLLCDYCSPDTDEDENGMLWVPSGYGDDEQYYACWKGLVYEVACSEFYTGTKGNRFYDNVCVLDRYFWRDIVVGRRDCSQPRYGPYKETE